ncbi:MAG: hypothetical protein H6718_18395 [Polyangiaceae bacterium]|nr:hypothetical protein [Myxococcales bacterium]MCB9587377.1 hypothetical protein [Polyangiaceae bacterium]MCB9605826.1 hypothetical protein [Polyangiaceae bacterium]
MKRVPLLSLLLGPLSLLACGTVQQDDGPPPVAPITRSNAMAYEASGEPAPFVQDGEHAVAARQALGVAGLDFGKGVLLACPGVKPPSFDYEEARMQASLEQSLEQLGRCAAVGRLAQSRLRLLVWDAPAGEALHALLVADGVQASRLQSIPQSPQGSPAGDRAPGSDAGPSTEPDAGQSASAEQDGPVQAEWLRSPKVRIELDR